MRIVLLQSIVLLALLDVFPVFGQTCQTLKDPKNGRVRLRGGGRIAKFRCFRKFELYGAKVIICSGDKWSLPPPICIRAGCDTVDTPSNMTVTQENDGAVLNFKCNAPLKLVGPKKITCDGKKWSAPAPTCEFEEPRNVCYFENENICGWQHDSQANFKWKWNSGTTPTRGTGPSYDHTLGKNGNGHYMFMESSSPIKSYDKARLLSPYFSATDGGECFDFWYHMYGEAGIDQVGKLNVYIEDLGQPISPSDTPAFSESGHQGDMWIRGIFPIGERKNSFRIVIEGQKMNSYLSDIAVDDVRVYNCSEDNEEVSTIGTDTEEPTIDEETTDEAPVRPKSTTGNKTTKPKTTQQVVTEATNKLTSAEPSTKTDLQTKKTTSATIPTSAATKSTTITTEITFTDNSTPQTTVVTPKQTTLTSTTETSTTKTTLPTTSSTTSTVSSATSTIVQTTNTSIIMTAATDKTTYLTTTLTIGTPTTVTDSTTPSEPFNKTMSLSTVNKTTLSNNVTITTSSISVEKTTPTTSVERKTTPSTSVEKTTPSTSVDKTTPPTTVEKTTLSTTVAKTTPSATVEKTTLSTNVAKTTPSTTVEKITLSTTEAKTALSTRKTTPSTAIEKTKPSTSTELQTSSITTTTAAATKPTLKHKTTLTTLTSTNPTVLTTELTTSPISKATVTTVVLTVNSTIVTQESSTKLDSFSPSENLKTFTSTNTPHIASKNVTEATQINITTTVPSVDVIPPAKQIDSTPLKPLMIGLGVGIAIGLIIVIGAIYIYLKKRRKEEVFEDEMEPIAKNAVYG